MLTLDDLLRAIKPQFVCIKHPEKILQTDPLISGNQSIGQIVFIGIALRNGFKRKEIMDFLGIETVIEYNRKQQLFKEAIHDFKKGMKTKQNEMINTKTNLTEQFIKATKKRPYVSNSNFYY